MEESHKRKIDVIDVMDDSNNSINTESNTSVCQICNKNKKDEQTIKCTKCSQSYHESCLDDSIEDPFICEKCQKSDEESQNKRIKKEEKPLVGPIKMNKEYGISNESLYYIMETHQLLNYVYSVVEIKPCTIDFLIEQIKSNTMSLYISETFTNIVSFIVDDCGDNIYTEEDDVEDESSCIDKQLYKGGSFSSFCTLNSWLYIYRLFVIRYADELKIPDNVMNIVNSCYDHEFTDLSIDERSVLLYYIMENLYDCEKVIDFINNQVTEQNSIYTQHLNNLKEIRESIKSVKEKGKDITVKIKAISSVLSQFSSNSSNNLWYLRDDQLTSNFNFEDDEKRIENLTIPESLTKFLDENKEFEIYNKMMIQAKNDRFKQLKRRFQAEKELCENEGKKFDVRNYLITIQSKQKTFSTKLKFHFQQLLNDKNPDLLNEAFKYGLCDRYVKKFAYPIVVIYMILNELYKSARLYRDPDEIINKKISDENEDFDRLLMKNAVRIKPIGDDSNGNRYFILPFDSSKLYFCHYSFSNFNSIYTFEPTDVKCKWYYYDGFKEINDFYIHLDHSCKELRLNIEKHLTFFELDNSSLAKRYRKSLDAVNIEDIDIGIESLIGILSSLEESIHDKLIFKNIKWKDEYENWIKDLSKCDNMKGIFKQVNVFNDFLNDIQTNYNEDKLIKALWKDEGLKSRWISLMDPSPTFGSFHVALIILQNVINRSNFKKIHVVKPIKNKEKDKEKESENTKKKDFSSPGIYRNLRKRDNKPKESKLSDKIRCAECHDTGGNLVHCYDCNRYFHSDCIDQNEDGEYICYECQNNDNEDDEDEDENENSGSDSDDWDNKCGVCHRSGDLLCCDGCTAAFHLKCIGLNKVPEDDWYCDKCTKIAEKVKGKKSKDKESGDSEEEEESEEDNSESSCTICGVGGSLICCDKCPKCYHLKCVNLTDVPEGEWICPRCNSDKCVMCNEEKGKGEVVYCQICKNMFHIDCLGIRRIPTGYWSCKNCRLKA